MDTTSRPPLAAQLLLHFLNFHCHIILMSLFLLDGMRQHGDLLSLPIQPLVLERRQSDDHFVPQPLQETDILITLRRVTTAIRRLFGHFLRILDESSEVVHELVPCRTSTNILDHDSQFGLIWDELDEERSVAPQSFLSRATSWLFQCQSPRS